MDADARGRIAALQQELRRLQEEVDRLQAALPRRRRPWKWVAAGVLALAAAAWLASSHPLWLVVLLVSLLPAAGWAAGAVLGMHGRGGTAVHLLPPAGAVALASVAVGVYAVPRLRSALDTQLEVAVLALALVAAAALLDAGWRNAGSQAAVAAFMVPVAGALSLAWPAFAITFCTMLAIGVLATASWRRFRAAPLVAAVGAEAVLVAHAAAGAPPAAVLGAAAALVAAFAVASWLRSDEADIVVQSAVWMATWGLGAWSLAQWGLPNGWWTVALGLLALRLGFTKAPPRLRMTWRAIGAGALLLAPLHLPWPSAVAGWWLIALAGAVAVARHRGGAWNAAPVVVGVLVALRLVSYEAARIPAAAALATWLAATTGLAAAWLVLRGPWRHLHLGLAVIALMMLVDLLLAGVAVAALWCVVAVALAGEGFAWRERSLQLAGLAAFCATILRVVLLDVAGADWRVIALVGAGILLVGFAWLAARWQRPVEDAEDA